MLVADEYLEYANFGRRKSVMRVRIYDTARGRFAVATETYNNPGAWITSERRAAVDAIQNKYGKNLHVIEHDPEDEDVFEMLTINRHDGLDEQALTPEAVVDLIGELPKHERAHEPAWLQLANEPVPETKRERFEREALEQSAAADERAWLISMERLRAVQPEYHGSFDPNGQLRVFLVDANQSREIAKYTRHQGAGFGAGYAGAGPALLARCILADLLDVKPLEDGVIPEIDTIFQDFKFQVIAKLPQRDAWVLPQRDVRTWYEQCPDKPGCCPKCRRVTFADPCAWCTE